MGSANSLGLYVDSLQERGQYTFTREEALAALGISATALKRAAERLKLKRRLAMPRRGFFVIVPLEYRRQGAPPSASFIDPLMRFQGTDYYVGLLSAAEIHGAAHQTPQDFQVLAGKQLRPAAAGRNRIRFFLKTDLVRTPVELVKTTSGRIRVSTAEATAFDLVRFYDRAGHLNYVATVLAELAEKIDAKKLVRVAEAGGESSVAQRLGYLLEKAGAAKAASGLAKWVERRSPKAVLLRPDRRSVEKNRGRRSKRLRAKAGAGFERDARWRVIVNEEIELDEL